MFEGKPPRLGDAGPLEERAPESDALRPLSWGELVSRLSAARDLRASLPPGSAREGEGSFDASCARRIAAHHNGNLAVNPADSSNGKAPQGTAFGAMQHGAGAGVVPGATGK
jgi:hypothetical protein